MFLRPSRSLNARIRALLGTRSFASSHEDTGPRGQGVPVLTRIRRMISSLATRTAHPFVLAQRAILLKVLEGLSCASSFTRATTECVTKFFSLRKKLVKHFSPPLGFYPESVWCCACVSFIRNASFSGKVSLSSRQTTNALSFDCVSRKAALFFVGLFLAPRRRCARG